MLNRFFPDAYMESAYAVPYQSLYEEGVRGLIFDIDNTLVPHGAPADVRSIELLDRLREMGFRICLLSNNDEARVELFNKDVHVHAIPDAHKPSPKNYRRAARLMEVSPEQTVFIGDQIFTDIYGAKRAGIRNILVEPIRPKEEEIQIILKRYLERIVLHFYRKSRIIKEP